MVVPFGVVTPSSTIVWGISIFIFLLTSTAAATGATVASVGGGGASSSFGASSLTASKHKQHQ